jgi:Putative zinc-finger
MSAPEHDRAALGAYALGALDPDETRAVDAHLAGCADCRAEVAELNELNAMLGEVPPEAFLDGPPDDGDLLLQRTLRQVRSERQERIALAAPEPETSRWQEPPAAGTSRSRRALLLVAAALVLIAGAGVVGGLIGRQTAEPVAGISPSPVPGTKTAKATDQSTGTAITATVVPKAGWVTVHADVRNLPVGAKCQLRVVDKAGNFMIAGSWLVSEKTAKEGSVVDGGALIPIDQVKSIDVYTFEGQRMVSAPL